MDEYISASVSIQPESKFANAHWRPSMNLVAYHRRHCAVQHRTTRKFVQCALGTNLVYGDGRFVLIAWCGTTTVSLHRSLEPAEKHKAMIDATLCGGRCKGHHQIVEIPESWRMAS